MVSLFFVIFLLLTVFFVVVSKKISKKQVEGNCLLTFCTVMSFICAIISAVLLVWMSVLFYIVGTGHTIDKMLLMYEEENASIEESLSITVKYYMDCDTNKYEDLSSKDAINLVSVIHELKTDTLVYKQKKVYENNYMEILRLKKDKINLSKTKWLLYFGE